MHLAPTFDNDHSNSLAASAPARHAEIARRYAWQAQQRRKRNNTKPNHDHLVTLIRLRELERLFRHRYGRFLPDDDAGMDDLVVAANHIAWLRGEVVAHIVAWARAWAPWLPSHEAERLAKRVAAEPRKWTADALAWRLRLSMAERTTLKITTIGAFDMSKAERETIQKERKRERERARRAKNSSGRPRGRPRKNACHAGIDTIAGHRFSPGISDAAREPTEIGNTVAASKEENHIGTFRAARPELVSLGEGLTAEVPSTASRAASPQTTISRSSEPPIEVIERAAKMAWGHRNSGAHSIGRREAKRLIEKFWPGYVRGQIASGQRYYGRFDPKRDLCNWDGGFRVVLDHEYEARQRYRERRRKWDQARKRAKEQQGELKELQARRLRDWYGDGSRAITLLHRQRQIEVHYEMEAREAPYKRAQECRERLSKGREQRRRSLADDADQNR